VIDELRLKKKDVSLSHMDKYKVAYVEGQAVALNFSQLSIVPPPFAIARLSSLTE